MKVCKCIPKKYFETSIENRLKLLAGLLDSDGWLDISKKESGARYGFT